LLSAFWGNQQRPVLYIIGDSTVKNGDGNGKNQQWGWGSLIQNHFDTTRIAVRNHAIGGRSSRTFLTDGRWDRILADLKPGDYVIMQFGHNDGAPLDDTARARGTIRGIGEESKDIFNPIRKVPEVVYSFGWYMRKYVNDAKAKGAIPIICSLVPRDRWKDGKVQRNDHDYALWAQQVAEATGAFYIDLNGKVADQYDVMGQEQVAPLFVGDHTHTSLTGATLNAASVATGVSQLNDCSLRNFLRK
jgi:lysophospholipase L1-like esterase